MSIRADMVSNCHWAAAHNAGIHYAEERPIPVGHPPRTVPLTTDCSGWATLCAKWAGAPDPNGLGYNGSGFTGTLLHHLWTRRSMRRARRGDLCVFGQPPGIHVVILLQTVLLHPDPLICSHGWEGEPSIMRLSEEAAGFPGQKQTFLNLLRNARGVAVAQAFSVDELAKGNPSVIPQSLKDMEKGKAT